MGGFLEYLPVETTFLDKRRAGAEKPASEARAVLIPFGLEETVSYGGGTVKGPEAILNAGPQLDVYDAELQRLAYQDYGLAVLKPPEIAKPLEAALSQLETLVEAVLAEGKFPLTLGGEHSLTAGAIRPFAKRYPNLAVLQFDAHGDLHDSYLGSRYSHACAMRRVLDHPGVALVSVGIRTVAANEAEYYASNRARHTIHWGHEQALWNIEQIVAPLKGRPLYITFDVDALDPSVMPATGTPVPGGLSYLQALEILRRACDVATVVGADVVELAPQPGLHFCDFTAAALTYKILNYALSGTRTG